MKNTVVFFLPLFFCFSFVQEGIQDKLASSALSLVQHHVSYDPAYFKISYPNGDVPANKGVCTDVVIRAYRKIGIDLQELIHEDMKKNFAQYPQLWGLSKPDTNIDHRRVPNLMKFFSTHGTILKTRKESKDYDPGDIVAWSLGGGLTHIGFVRIFSESCIANVDSSTVN